MCRQARNVPGTEKSPDVIPKTKEALDQPSNVPDLCSIASDNVSRENGQKTVSQTENNQKKFIIKNSGNFKVASKNEKYTLTKKTIQATQVRTSALSNSLKESTLGKSPETQSDRQVDNSTGLSPNRRKSAEDVFNGFASTPPDLKLRDTVRELRHTDPELRDTGRKLRDTDRKLHDHNKASELLSQSLPVSGSNASKDSPQVGSAIKRSDQSYSSTQRKISHNANTYTPKSSENASQQPVLTTGLSRSPTPKMFFSNLMNRLSGRLSGNSPSTSSVDSRSSSSSSSRASTPTLMQQNVALSFRLSADEFSSCDHKLKLYFEVSLFRWGNHEEFRCLLKVRDCFF